MAKIKPSDYSYHVINIGDEEEDAFEAIIPKFPNVHAYGDNAQELNDGVIAGLEVALEDLKKAGKTPPPPDKKSDFNGKILLRINPEIHEKLYYESLAHNLSLNKYIANKLK